MSVQGGSSITISGSCATKALCSNRLVVFLLYHPSSGPAKTHSPRWSVDHVQPLSHGSPPPTAMLPLWKHFMTLTSLVLRMLLGPTTADSDFVCVVHAGLAEWEVLKTLATLSMSPAGHCLRNNSFSFSTAPVAPSNITAASA